MSTNQKLPNRTAETQTGKQPDDKKAEKGQLGLSVTQVVGGALAAMTAAALGSQLSVAGTVVDIMTDDQGHIAGQRSHLVAPEPEPPRQGGSKLNWKRVVVAALAAFG